MKTVCCNCLSLHSIVRYVHTFIPLLFFCLRCLVLALTKLQTISIRDCLHGITFCKSTPQLSLCVCACLRVCVKQQIIGRFKPICCEPTTGHGQNRLQPAGNSSYSRSNRTNGWAPSHDLESSNIFTRHWSHEIVVVWTKICIRFRCECSGTGRARLEE